MTTIDWRRLTGPTRGGAASPRARRATTAQTGVRRWMASGTHTRESTWLLSLAGAFLLLGLAMTFSASFVQSTADTGDAFGVFARQAVWAALGIPVVLVATFVDYRFWRASAGVAVLVTLAAMLAVLFIGEEVNGARRWFTVGPVSVQPAEIIKLTLPLWCASTIAGRWGAISRGNVWSLLGLVGPVIVISSVLVALGPDLESAVLVGAIGATALFVAGLPVRLVVLGAAVGGAAAWWSVVSTPYRVGRFAAWMDPTAFADTYGYQTTQGFLALGSGGWFGVGLGQGRGKWLYIPNAHTDFIYAIIGEELGLLGALVVLLAFTFLGFLGIRIAARAEDIFGRLLASSITAWLFLQAAINISSVVGLLPVTGVTLPLVSFGGTSLVVTMAGVGLLASIARHPNPRMTPHHAPGVHPGITGPDGGPA